MATRDTAADVAEINLDVPCASCGYNLRGLAGNGQCPECGASVARSLEIHLNPIMPAQIWWARIVLAGLVTWMVLTPVCLCVVLFMGRSYPNLAFMWMNYPGPKLWAVPIIQPQLASTGSSPLGLLGHICPLLVVLASFLITAPRTRRGGPESFWSLRRLTRWPAVVMAGGLFGVSVATFAAGTSIAQLLVFLAVCLVELPVTVLMYQYLGELARRLDLLETAIELRLCGWVAGAVMLGSAMLLVLGLNPLLTGSIPILLIGFWFAGAIAVGTAIVACTNLLRLMMALWPIAMVRLARRSQ
jgi:hypothetical protein